MNFRKILFLTAWLLSGSVIFGQTAERKTKTLGGARSVIAAAEAKAQELKAPGRVIAIVEAGRHQSTSRAWGSLSRIFEGTSRPHRASVQRSQKFRVLGI